jgi:hypothetical protein
MTLRKGPIDLAAQCKATLGGSGASGREAPISSTCPPKGPGVGVSFPNLACPFAPPAARTENYGA